MFKIVPYELRFICRAKGVILKIGNFKIYNTAGQIEQQGTLQQKLNLNIADWTKGIYTIEITMGGNKWEETFIKQ